MMSCINEEPAEEPTGLGSIKGVASYSNADDNSSIYITIEKLKSENRAAEQSSGELTAEDVVYTKADVSGNYSFTDLPAGKYKIYAASTTSSEQVVSVFADVVANTITIPDDITFTATGSLSGKIILDGDETKSSGILVYISGTSYIAITDENGSFTISDVPAGKEYVISIIKGLDSVVWQTVKAVEFTDTDVGTKELLSSELTLIAGADGKDGVDGINGINGADGKDGVGIVWRGAFDNAESIENPITLNAYYNTKDGCSYIYINDEWTLLASAGAKGDSVAGEDGKCVTWRGDFASETEIENPKELDMYFNTTDSMSYIYNGESWDLLAVNGKDGNSIEWLGSFVDWDDFAEQIQNPKKLNVVYIASDCCSYIFDGMEWCEFVSDGYSRSINWLGNYESFDALFQIIPYFCYLDAFHNNQDGCSYIYNGASWDVLASSGGKGDKGDKGDRGPQGIQGEKGPSGEIYSDLPFRLNLALMEGSLASDVKAPENYIPGEDIILPTVICEDKDFAGWFWDSSYTRECEFVSYNETSNKYILTVPENYTGSIMLYAGIGKVFKSWGPFVEYTSQSSYNSFYGNLETIFFSGTVNVTSDYCFVKHAGVMWTIRGINDATLVLSASITRGGQPMGKFDICNITVDGQNQYEYSNMAFYGEDALFRVRNCTFKNLKQNTSLFYMVSTGSQDAKILIENCSFENCNVKEGVIGGYGMSRGIATIKNCTFKNCQAENYGVITSNNSNFIFENCNFENNTSGLIRDNYASLDGKFDLFDNGNNLILKGDLGNLTIAATGVSLSNQNLFYSGPIVLDGITSGNVTLYVNVSTIPSNVAIICNKDSSEITDEQLQYIKIYDFDKNPIEIDPYGYLLMSECKIIIPDFDLSLFDTDYLTLSYRYSNQYYYINSQTNIYGALYLNGSFITKTSGQTSIYRQNFSKYGITEAGEYLLTWIGYDYENFNYATTYKVTVDSSLQITAFEKNDFVENVFQSGGIKNGVQPEDIPYEYNYDLYLDNGLYFKELPYSDFAAGLPLPPGNYTLKLIGRSEMYPSYVFTKEVSVKTNEINIISMK